MEDQKNVPEAIPPKRATISNPVYARQRCQSTEFWVRCIFDNSDRTSGVKPPTTSSATNCLSENFLLSKALLSYPYPIRTQPHEWLFRMIGFTHRTEFDKQSLQFFPRLFIVR
jgi:hypothetical protein